MNVATTGKIICSCMAYTTTSNLFHQIFALSMNKISLVPWKDLSLFCFYFSLDIQWKKLQALK